MNNTQPGELVMTPFSDIAPIERTHAEKLDDRIATFVHRVATGEWSEETACAFITIAVAKYTVPRPPWPRP